MVQADNIGPSPAEAGGLSPSQQLQALRSAITVLINKVNNTTYMYSGKGQWRP
jgi:hypothetical protein